MTQIIVLTDAPGFQVVRDVPVWGEESGHHGEIILDHVRVPLENLLDIEGSVFAIGSGTGLDLDHCRAVQV